VGDIATHSVQRRHGSHHLLEQRQPSLRVRTQSPRRTEQFGKPDARDSLRNDHDRSGGPASPALDSMNRGERGVPEGLEARGPLDQQGFGPRGGGQLVAEVQRFERLAIGTEAAAESVREAAPVHDGGEPMQ
jgi:hypothetical protein